MNVGELLLREPASVDWERLRNESPGLFTLAVDIGKNGVQSPILLDEDGRIEDGIHRLCACWLLSWKGDIPTEQR